MTCEIAIMNKQAVVLAADSATTVTQWVGGEKEERYFKGTNKIFQLSSHHPVGIMTYAAANLQGVPWEIIAKDFREYLGDKSFNDIDGYAKEFHDYMEGHRQLFPSDFQRSSVLSDGSRAAMIHLLARVLKAPAVKDAGDDNEKRTAIAEMLETDLREIDSEELSSHFEESDFDEALASYTPELANLLNEQIKDVTQDAALIDLTKLSELALKSLIKRYSRYMDRTGLVFAGFGDNNYFPVYREYNCYGLLLGKFLLDEVGGDDVSREKPSCIKPFATTEMVHTFVVGLSPDVYGLVRQETAKSLREMAEWLSTGQGFELDEEVDAKIQTLVETHTDSWTDPAFSNHAWPLRRVVGSLPIDEMAELAETLIMLESLKEKVTRPTESVGGPIDVCVISKSDGFIWVKRKHYFSPELNPQFFRRQSAKFK